MSTSSSSSLARPAPEGNYPYDLGTYSLPIATNSPEAQIWFDRGLNWSYAFHHEEAERCFRYALACDDTCAMAYWGVAYAGGPNYNKAWERFDEDDLRRSLQKCHLAVTKSQEYATTPLESALANALATRFPSNREGDYKEWNLRFADAMKDVHDEFNSNLDVNAIYADSMMALAPWELWDLQTGKPREDSRTLTIKSVLEHSFTLPGAFTHPGLLHFYIHLMELSPSPETALPAADRLRGLVPDGGHLNHMPGHLDLLIGDYRRAISSNLDAIRGDEKYMRTTCDNDFYTFYRLHDYTFPIYAGMFNGQYKVAIETVERMEESLTDEFLRTPSPPMIDWMEGFKSFRVHVYVRFGKWKEILDLPFPSDRAFYAVTTTMLHYARGLAYSVLGDVDSALHEQALFRESVPTIPSSRFEFPNTWQDILAIADAMLTGEIEYRRGNYNLAFDKLRESIKLSDNLIYAEPWGWLQPPRHAYAALQLEQGNVEAAAKTYAEDLGFDDALPRAVRHPNNVWALHGYHECLVKLGRTSEAKIIAPQLTLALAIADVSIESSCFCRRTKPAGNATLCCAT
jgi:tetratricopeptide (TPR) repeat protein